MHISRFGLYEPFERKLFTPFPGKESFMRSWISVLLVAVLFIPAFAAPNEGSGSVTYVVDGDTIDVDGIGRVRLADIDCPEMSTAEGPVAKEFTEEYLSGEVVYLDIDDLRETDNYGRTIAIVYLQKPDGTLENFNQMLVDSGQARIWDFDDNEFNPAEWWDGMIPAIACIKMGSSDPTPSGSSVASSSNGPFVGSAKSDKYHYPSCSAAKKIKSSNLVTFSGSADARASGYVPCGICHPP